MEQTVKVLIREGGHGCGRDAQLLQQREARRGGWNVPDHLEPWHHFHHTESLTLGNVQIVMPHELTGLFLAFRIQNP